MNVVDFYIGRDDFFVLFSGKVRAEVLIFSLVQFSSFVKREANCTMEQRKWKSHEKRD